MKEFKITSFHEYMKFLIQQTLSNSDDPTVIQVMSEMLETMETSYYESTVYDEWS